MKLTPDVPDKLKFENVNHLEISRQKTLAKLNCSRVKLFEVKQKKRCRLISTKEQSVKFKHFQSLNKNFSIGLAHMIITTVGIRLPALRDWKHPVT